MAVRDVAARPTAVTRGRSLERALGPDWKLAFPLVTPIVVVMLGLIAYPFLSSIWFSLQAIRVGGPGKFVGLANYQSLLFGPLSERFWSSVQISLEYTLGALIFKFIIGMTTALILHEALVARNVWRALVFIPWSIPSVVSAYTWKWMYDDLHGVINLDLMALGVVKEPILFLADINWALWAVMAAVVWRGTPFWTMTFLAGMQSIPSDMYDAAHIDGCGAAKSFWYITLPNLMPVILVTTMLSGIWTANEVQYVYLLTHGGPANATETFPMLALTLGVSNFDLGMGATVPLIFFPVFAVVIYFLTRRMLAWEARG